MNVSWRINVPYLQFNVRRFGDYDKERSVLFWLLGTLHALRHNPNRGKRYLELSLVVIDSYISPRIRVTSNVFVSNSADDIGRLRHALWQLALRRNQNRAFRTSSFLPLVHCVTSAGECFLRLVLWAGVVKSHLSRINRCRTGDVRVHSSWFVARCLLLPDRGEDRWHRGTDSVLRLGSLGGPKHRNRRWLLAQLTLAFRLFPNLNSFIKRY
jgi:hypothetical protein